MCILSEEKLNYWADVYQRLDRLYGLHTEIDFEFFLDNPKTNERWIHIYFANPHLFKNRDGSGFIWLSVFLANDPQFVMTVVLQRDTAEFGWDFLPLLPRQRKFKANWEKLAKYYEEIDEHYRPCKKQIHPELELHGDRVMQTINHRAAPKKYKTGGMAHV